MWLTIVIRRLIVLLVTLSHGKVRVLNSAA